MHYVIFSIDKAWDLHTKAKFLRYIDTQRALGELKGNMVLCIGSYKGVLEDSFILRADDFDRFVRQSPYISGQESVLHVKGRDMHCKLEIFYEGYTGMPAKRAARMFSLGRMVQMTKEEAYKQDGWTYRPDLDIYWSVEE